MLTQDKYTSRLMAHNLRGDGRQPLQLRQYLTQFLPLPGHLLFSIGGTKVCVKTKMQITSPRNQRPNQGQVFFRVNCQSCQGNFQQIKKLSAQTTKLLQTVIVGSKALDPQSLCILSSRYVWKVTVQIIVICDEGNVIDCVLNGAIVALLDMRKPLVRLEDSEMTVDSSVKQPLSLAHLPLSFTFGLTENNIFVDPSMAQERIAPSRITVSMNIYKQLCSIHKPGGLGISETSLNNCVKTVEQLIQKKNNWLRQIVKNRPIVKELI